MPKGHVHAFAGPPSFVPGSAAFPVAAAGSGPVGVAPDVPGVPFPALNAQCAKAIDPDDALTCAAMLDPPFPWASPESNSMFATVNDAVAPLIESAALPA